MVRAGKDPNAPKRGKSSFIYFSTEFRSKVQAENPTLGTQELSKILGARWGNMTDLEKQPYRDLQDQDKLRYEREKAAYVPPPDLPRGYGKKKKKDPNRPKKAKTAFICFSMALRGKIKEETPNLSVPETGKRLGEMWSKLSDHEKQPYVKMHEDDKVRYIKAMEEYNKAEEEGKDDAMLQNYGDEEEVESFYE